jgi:nucleoside-diphosphate-sugar epimerase
MNIIFFGSTSFVAQDLVNYLDLNYNTYFFSRKKKGKKNYIYFDLKKKNKKIGKLIKFKKIDYLFFFSSLVPLNEKNSTWKQCKETNVYGLARILSNLKIKVKKIILASSCSLYEREEKLNDEETLLKPDNGYALTKLMQEKILKVHCDNNKIKFLSYRLGYVYGKYMNNERLLKRLLLKYKNNKKIRIYNKNLNLNLIYAKDISNLILKTFTKAEGIYNLTDKHTITLGSFYKALKGEKNNTIKKNNTFSSKKFFNHFPKLKINKLEDRIKNFKDEN